MALSEFGLIRQYFSGWPLKAGVIDGVGDDCAILEPLPGYQLVVSVDTMVEGTHFPKPFDAEAIGRRVLLASISDLAAMGASPLGFTLALTLPKQYANHQWLSRFSSGLKAVAESYQIALVGGDTTQGPLAISIQVMGQVPQHQALKRSTANPGDLLYVTGTLGDSAAGLSLVVNTPYSAVVEGIPEDQKRYLLKRFIDPEPRVQFAEQVREEVSSALDVSDGLLADVSHILSASDVGARIQLKNIPLSPVLQQMDHIKREFTSVLPELSDLSTPYFWALTGGEDFELCFTVPVCHKNTVEEKAQRCSLPVHCIGHIVDQQQGLKLEMLDGQCLSVSAHGFQHFS